MREGLLENIFSEIIFPSIEHVQSISAVNRAFSFVKHLKNLWILLKNDCRPSIGRMQSGEHPVLMSLGQSLKETKEKCKKWNQRRDRPFLLWREFDFEGKNGLSTETEEWCHNTDTPDIVIKIPRGTEGPAELRVLWDIGYPGQNTQYRLKWYQD